MKILFVTPDVPYPAHGGGAIRVAALMSHLAEHHSVSLITLDREGASEDRVGELRRMCDDVVVVPIAARQQRHHKRKYQLLSLISREPYQHTLYFSRTMQAAIDQYCQEKHVDIVSVEFSQMGYYHYPEKAATVLDLHNIEHEVLYRTYRRAAVSIRKLYLALEWYKYRQKEIDLCRKFSLCLATSETDRRLLISKLPFGRCVVIPNGVDIRMYDGEFAEIEADPVVVFSGTIDYYPNIDGLRFFVRDILPLLRRQVPGVTFYIVGRDPPPEIRQYADDPGIVVTGYVDDVRPYLKRAAVTVVPLRIGGGTRLKILEAMAMRRPVVSTSIGAEGLSVNPGKNILVADEPDTFARAVASLLLDGGLRRRVAAEGRGLVEERYDWKRVSAQLEQAYQCLLAERKGGRA